MRDICSINFEGATKRLGTKKRESVACNPIKLSLQRLFYLITESYEKKYGDGVRMDALAYFLAYFAPSGGIYFFLRIYIGLYINYNYTKI